MRSWIRKTVLLTLVLVMGVTLMGCTFHVSFGQRHVRLSNEYVSKTVKPRVEEESWKVVIDKMIFLNSGNVSIRLIPSDTTYVEAYYSEELERYGFKITAENGVIRVATGYNYTYSTECFELTIYANFHELQLKGGYELDVDATGMRELEIRIDGAANCEVTNLQAERVGMKIAGAAKVEAQGFADLFEVNLSGAGDIDAKYLGCLVANVELKGAGSVSVSVEELLNVDIAGVSSVRYYGSPKVRRNIAGLASVEQASDHMLAGPTGSM